MKLNHIITVLTILSVLSISGCDKESTQADIVSDVQQEQDNIKVVTESDTAIENNDESAVSEAETKIESGLSTEQVSMLPLEQYHDVNIDSNNDWVTSLFIAQTTRALTDEDKLNFLSPEYYNETDGFRKREIEQTLMPQIEQQIAQYGGDYRIKAPIVNEAGDFYYQQKEQGLSSNFVRPHLGIGTYNFDNQSFTIEGCDDLNFGVLNEQKMSIQPIGSDGVREHDLRVLNPVVVEDCQLDVSDEQLARKIEQARSMGNIRIKGTMYFYLKGTDNYVVSYPEFADLTFYDKTTGETLADKQLHFKIVSDGI